MLIKKHSFMYHVMMHIPMWMPFGMRQTRVGTNTEDYFTIFRCKTFAK